MKWACREISEPCTVSQSLHFKKKFTAPCAMLNDHTHVLKEITVKNLAATKNAPCCPWMLSTKKVTHFSVRTDDEQGPNVALSLAKQEKKIYTSKQNKWGQSPLAGCGNEPTSLQTSIRAIQKLSMFSQFFDWHPPPSHCTDLHWC